MKKSRIAVAAAGALSLCGTADCIDTDTHPPAAAVYALFDPTGMPPVIPFPNELLNLPATPATSAGASFSGAVDPAKISFSSVLVLDVTAMAPLLGASPSLDGTGKQLSIAPPMGGWPPGHRIAVALRGSPGGLVGVGGTPVVAGPTFYFARSAKPLSNCTAPGPDCTSATPVLPVAQAIQLEQLRQALAPLVTALIGLGVPREEQALVWTFLVAGSAPDGGAPDGGGPDASPSDGGPRADGGK